MSRSADFASVAVRLHNLEDKLQEKLDEPGGGGDGGSGLGSRAFASAFWNAGTGGVIYDTPYDAENVYEANSSSLHMAVIGNGGGNFPSTFLQNIFATGVSFLHQTFSDYDVRFTTTPLATVVLGSPSLGPDAPDDFVDVLSGYGSLAEAVFGSPSDMDDVLGSEAGASLFSYLMARIGELDQRVTTLEDKVADLESWATVVDTALADHASALANHAARLTALEETPPGSTEDSVARAAIDTLGGRVTTLETDHGGAITALSGAVEELQERPDLSGAVDTLGTELTNLGGRVTALEGAGPSGSSVFIDVRSHGAAGDGTTDDTAALQAALTAAATALASGAAASASVYVPAGTYVTDPVYIPASNITVFGDGWGSTVIRQKPRTVENIESIGVINAHGTAEARLSRITLRGICVDANKANALLGVGVDEYAYCAEAVSMAYVDFPVVERCAAMNAHSEGFDFDYCADGYVRDSFMSNCGGCGVHFSNGCVRMHGSGCIAVGCGSALQRSGFDIHNGTDHSSYTDCHSRDCYYGFHMKGNKGLLSGCTSLAHLFGGIRVNGNHNTVSGCSARDGAPGSGNGLTIDGGTHTCVNGGNYSGNLGHGINLLSGATDCAITGAISTGNNARGINLNSGANNNAVVGCVTTGNGLGGTSNSGSGNVLSGNVGAS